MTDDPKSIPSDWDHWGEWSTNSLGEITRERKCLKEDGNCRGKKMQKKVRRFWKQVGEFLVDNGLKPGGISNSPTLKNKLNNLISLHKSMFL